MDVMLEDYKRQSKPQKLHQEMSRRELTRASAVFRRRSYMMHKHRYGIVVRMDGIHILKVAHMAYHRKPFPANNGYC